MVIVIPQEAHVLLEYKKVLCEQTRELSHDFLDYV